MLVIVFSIILYSRVNVSLDTFHPAEIPVLVGGAFRRRWRCQPVLASIWCFAETCSATRFTREHSVPSQAQLEAEQQAAHAARDELAALSREYS